MEKPPADFDPRPAFDRGTTTGNWSQEHEAEAFLSDFLETTGLFCVYRQVRGCPLWAHSFQDRQDVRADLLLLPSTRLVSAGWTGGAIVIEVKRSGEKIGPACNQLVDYLNSAWRVPETGGVLVVPAFGFVFPAHRQGGPLASIMAHQHIGTAGMDREWLDCHCGHSRVISIRRSGEFRLGRLNFGLKLGSR